MDSETATTRIETALQKLEGAFGEAVFDEWALVQKTPGGWKILVYRGPRREAFRKNFHADMAALRETFDPDVSEPGEFAFSHEGYGSGFDAHLCAGRNLFILFNNTAKSTGEFTRNPRWRAAQVYFMELVESFIADPLDPGST